MLSDPNLGARLGTEVLERARELGVARRVLTSADRHALREVDAELATEILVKPVSRAVIAALVGAVPRSATGLRRPDLGGGSSREGEG